MRPEDHDMELEPGPPDPSDVCPVCWKYERDCTCPYDDCEPLKEQKACLSQRRKPHEARGSAASNACYGAL